MKLSTEFWVQIVIQAVTVGMFAGIVLTKLKYLEKKQDKHNKLIERMATVEVSCRSAHHRIDELKK